ncbi:hypothetical protein ACFQ51_04360 [Streptomyces kaempferi]
MYAAESYLKSARDAELVRTVSGLPCVAGVSTDPLSDERRLLVEYADPELLSDDEASRTLWRTLLADRPEVSALVVRAAPPSSCRSRGTATSPTYGWPRTRRCRPLPTDPGSPRRRRNTGRC